MIGSKNGSKSIWHFFKCPLCTDLDEDTRQQLLVAAYAEIHQCGYQAASLNQILKRTGLTKGALYHYFSNKKALGLAVLDEIVSNQVEQLWLVPLQQGDPIQAIIDQIVNAGNEFSMEDIRLGCPLNNLSQEMAPLDEVFREHIETIYKKWREGVQSALERGINEGFVKPDINAENMATVIVAALEGCLGLAKTGQNKKILINCGRGLINVLQSLRNN